MKQSYFSMTGLKRTLTRKLSRDHTESFLATHARKGKTLDIGGGNTPYRTYFPDTVCLDIEKKPSVDVVGDAHNLPFPNESFDTVLCTGVLNALHTPQQAINEMNRVLKSGGVLILVTDSILFPLHGVPWDYFRPTAYGLHLWCERAGFSEITIEAESTHRSVAILFQRLAMQCDFHGGTFIRGLYYLIAQTLVRLPDPFKQEYGNVYRSKKVLACAPAGLYMVAKKPLLFSQSDTPTLQKK